MQSEFPISSYLKAADQWVEPHLPAKAMVKWLEQLANDLSEKKDTLEIKDMIKEAFNSRKLSSPSKVKYMSYLKSLLMENGLLLNPSFTPHLEAVCSKYFKNHYLSNLFEQQSSNYARWRLWMHLQYATPKDVPPAHKLFQESYLRRDLFINTNLLDKRMWGEVQQLAKDKLMRRPEIKIENKTEFLQTTLSGLQKTDDMGALFCALLLACGRRPSTLHLSLDRWALVPEQEDDPCILFLETLKKRGHLCSPAEIPLLCSGKVFLKALKTFQRLCSCLKEGETAKICTEENAQAIWGGKHRMWCRDSHAGKFRPKDFRAVYSAFVAQRGDSGLSGPAAVSQALVHTVPGTALSYLHVNLLDTCTKTDESSLKKPE